MGLTAFVCATCRLLGNLAWPLAAPMFISGLLIWRTRKVRYAALPGLAIGFVVGATLTLSLDPLVKIGGGIWLATIIGCPLNAWIKGFPKLGCSSLVLAIASMIAAAWLLPN
jgi:hypothetical protein